MVFDPTEEQFDLPTGAIKLRDRQGWKLKVVGEENQPQVLLGIEVMNAPQGHRIAARTQWTGEANGLVGTQTGRTIYSAPRTATIVRVAFGARHEECQSLGDEVEAPVIDVTPVEQVKRSGFPIQLIEPTDVVDRPTGQINGGRNVATQIEQGVQLHRTFASSELRPRKNRQAQIDRRRVEDAYGLFQLHGERFVSMKGASLGDERAGEAGVDAPVALLVGTGQRVARNVAPKAHVIKLFLMRVQAGFDVAQTFAIRELRKSQTKELIEARKTLDFVVALVALHAMTKLGQGQQVHQLSKNRPATVQAPSLRGVGDGPRVSRNSNRFCSISWATHQVQLHLQQFLRSTLGQH